MVAALIFFGNSHIVVRRWPELFEHVIDRTVMHRFSFVGAFLSSQRSCKNTKALNASRPLWLPHSQNHDINTRKEHLWATLC